jgi:hypothetical protein
MADSDKQKVTHAPLKSRLGTVVLNLRTLASSRAQGPRWLASPRSSAPLSYQNTWGRGRCICHTRFWQPAWNRGASLSLQRIIKQYIWNIASAWPFTTDAVSYSVFMPKPSTHRVHDPGSIVPHIRPKVFIDNQMSWIKYNYYINNISKDYDDSQAKHNSRRLHNTTGMATGATRSQELLVEEFQSIFSFWAVGLSSRGK